MLVRQLRSVLERIKKALRNPIYVVESLVEWLFTYYWTCIFRIKCLLRKIPVGSKVEIYGDCIIRKGIDSNIIIGDGVQIISSSWRSSTANCGPSKLRTFYSSASIIFEENSGMTGGTIVARSKRIRIGKNCMLAPNVVILDSDFHIMWPPDRRRNTWETDIDQDVTLENNVWIGLGSVILKGVRIGENSVIAAGSVVTSDIPDNCLAAGNPAKVIRRLDVSLN